ncbi:Surfeit locus 1 [Micractinium conductrix]|uniref:SURF1-like protein n=1 Tax=Micractinium conductrix TaxID=554055 RepID=A0A2P6V765_9CHLO|nr:Surfeit locus 1 [Micractinium conductrix]|eukprot:PSC69935.1 Surfeit locus 1 [Micractinium conductrix]
MLPFIHLPLGACLEALRRCARLTAHHTALQQHPDAPAQRVLSEAVAGLGGATRRRAADAACRRSFAAEAVPARPGPVPRGTSRAGSGRSVWSGLFLLAPGCLAAFLGKWQWDRRQWKQELLDRRQAMMEGEPLDLLALEEEPAEYVRVSVEGVFDHAASQYVGPRTRTIAGNSKQGFLCMTPLRQPGSGRAVLVHRGWVPKEWREEAGMRSSGLPTGTVKLEGILRKGEDPGSFVPPNEPERGNWFYVNVAELAAAAGLPAGAPLMEVVTETPGSYIGRGPPSAMDVLGGRGHIPKVEEQYPLPKSMQDMMHFSVMPQDHLNYAATWWTLSAATLALAVKAIRQGIKPR